MAGKKPQVPIVIPSTGTRKDIDPHVATADMAVAAENVVAFDQVIRPRPALNNEGFGAIAQPWSQVYDDGDFGPDWHPYAFCQLDDGTLLVSCRNDTTGAAQRFMHSTDQGESWQVTAAVHPEAADGDHVITWMAVYNEKLFCHTQNFDATWDPEVDAGVEYIYRSALTSFPATLSFDSIGPIEFNKFDHGWGGPDPYLYSFLDMYLGKTEISYDEDNDALMFLYMSDNGVDAGGYEAWCIYDASTTTGAGDVTHLGNQPPLLGGVYYSNLSWANRKWLTYTKGTALFAQPPQNYARIVTAYCIQLEWNGSDYTYDADVGNYMTIYNNNLANPINIGTYEIDSTGVVSIGGRALEVPYTDDLFYVLQYSVSSLFKQMQLMRVSMNSSGFDEHEITESWGPEFTLASAYDPFDTDHKLAIFTEGDLENSDKTYVITSANAGETWQRSVYGGLDIDLSASNRGHEHVNRVTDQHFVHDRTSSGVSTYYQYNSIWYMPSSAAPNLYGSPTQVGQIDLDEEDQAIIVGTTKALLRLDRTNNLWDRITADHLQTVDTGVTGVWTESGDIPPLSVTDDRTEYVSGVSIDSAYGDNHWVFRSIEVQGKTFFLATNGQCYPIAYHEDMEGGFARRMGEVQPTDPNDLPAFDPLDYPAGYLRTGNLAPKASCMAVGANRVLLGNLGISPFGVDTSAFSDCDRGWGLTQTTLLGDTPGPIVSMNEVSALQIAIYKTDAIYHAVAQTEFMGVAAPFRFELAKAGVVGPCSPSSVLRNYDGRQIYLGRDGGVYMYDGVAPIDGGRNIRRMVQPYLDPNQLEKCWGMVDYRRKLIWFFYPTKGGQVNKGIVLSTDQGYPWQCWPITLPVGWNFTTGLDARFSTDPALEDLGGVLGDYGDATLGSFSTGEQFMIMGRENNTWYTQDWDDDGTYTDDGAPLSVLMDTGWTNPPGSGGASTYMLDELYHIFNSPDPDMELQIRVKAQQLGENVRYSEARDLYAGKVRRKTSHRVSGTRFGVEMSGKIRRSFTWGGAISTIIKRGER